MQFYSENTVVCHMHHFVQMESHMEARMWNSIFTWTEQEVEWSITFD